MLDLTKPKRPIKVIVGSPVGESVKPGYMVSMLGLFGSLNPDEVLMQPVPIQGSNIAENQNSLVDQAIERGADYIFLVETDMGFPANSLGQLLSHGKDIVGATYAYKDRDVMAKLLRGDKIHYRYMGHELEAKEITLESLIRGEPLRRVSFIPMGLTLISMKAVEAVEKLMHERTAAPEGKRAPVFFHNVSYPLDRKRGINSTTDSAFCSAARDAGLDVWLDARLSLQVEHIGDACFGLLPDEQQAANDAV